MPDDRWLWLLRHAKAAVDPPPGGGDHERPLSAKGRRDADALGRRLGEGGDRLGLGGFPQLVLCSTASRTKQTAERALAELADPPPVRYERELYDASPDHVIEELHELDDELFSVMVVGHNPTAEVLAGALGGGKRARRAARALPTCGLAVFGFAGPWADVTLGSATSVELFLPPF
ncbi:MAG TPA: histidine phosphatase family protein [Acidimicrobiales bacterium]|nr:histidine phosphatase family protein [Acidimicrobiales bacterium]